MRPSDQPLLLRCIRTDPTGGVHNFFHAPAIYSVVVAGDASMLSDNPHASCLFIIILDDFNLYTDTGNGMVVIYDARGWHIRDVSSTSCVSGMGTAWGRFRNISEKEGTAKDFEDGMVKFWKCFRNVFDV
ncbi:hypothetical protein Bca4012_025987 [Brassica carinata]